MCRLIIKHKISHYFTENFLTIVSLQNLDYNEWSFYRHWHHMHEWLQLVPVVAPDSWTTYHFEAPWEPLPQCTSRSEGAWFGLWTRDKCLLHCCQTFLGTQFGARFFPLNVALGVSIDVQSNFSTCTIRGLHLFQIISVYSSCLSSVTCSTAAGSRYRNATTRQLLPVWLLRAYPWISTMTTALTVVKLFKSKTNIWL